MFGMFQGILVELRQTACKKRTTKLTLLDTKFISICPVASGLKMMSPTTLYSSM